MTSKTREAIANVLTDFEVEGLDHTEALAKICAILDKEREGERVLSIGTFYAVHINLMDGRNVYKAIASNQRGRLIFVPD